MLKNLAVGWMLTVATVQGVTPALPVILPVSSADALATAKPATVVQLALPTETATPLSRAEMGEVRGSGLFSWITKLISKVTLVLKVLGLIKQILELFREKTETKTSSVEGGDTQQRSESETVEYASDADYNAGNASSVDNQATSSWQQTEVWYGDGGGCGGSVREGGYYQEQQMMNQC